MRPFGILLLALVAGAFPVPARATSVDPMTWDQITLQADFIGVVTCAVAGGIVARYRVDETWKGAPAVGGELALRVGADYWGPQFPIALCGQRYLVAAWREKRATPPIGLR